MVIRVTWQTVVYWGRYEVPGVILINRLIYSIFVFVSLEAIVRHVVGEALIPETVDAINEMEFKRACAKQQIDAYPHANVDNVIPGHLIE